MQQIKNGVAGSTGWLV